MKNIIQILSDAGLEITDEQKKTCLLYTSSAEQNRLINIYILSTPILGRDRHGEWKEKDLELIRTTSQLEIVNCLKDIDVYKRQNES